jgi:putative zinc finger/helix-turn-helix YgiT family protein
MNEIGKKIENGNSCCPMCEAHSIIINTELEKFEYGIGKNMAVLSVYIPVNQCQSCGYEFVGERADELRHDAICNHLKLLTPGRIQEMRVRLSGSQKNFAELTHLGQASIQRWEQRQVLQSESNDLYLRLLEFPENVERLERWNRGEDMQKKKDLKKIQFKGFGLDASAVNNLGPASQTFFLKRKAG